MDNKIIPEDGWYTKTMLRMKYHVIIIEIISGLGLLFLAIHSFYIKQYAMSITCLIIGIEFLYFLFVDLVFFKKLHRKEYEEMTSSIDKLFHKK